MNTNPTLIQRSRSSLCLVLCVAGAILPISAFAQGVVRESRDVRVVEPARTLKKADRDFLEKAAKASMSEVQISRVAAARTTNADVRRFAQAMIEDHENATEQIANVASARSVALPAKDPHPDKWEKHDAKDFDKDYLEKMISDHEDVVKMFERQAKDGEDPDTLAVARKLLPKMQQHLQHAIDLKRALTEKR